MEMEIKWRNEWWTYSTDVPYVGDNRVHRDPNWIPDSDNRLVWGSYDGEWVEAQAVSEIRRWGVEPGTIVTLPAKGTPLQGALARGEFFFEPLYEIGTNPWGRVEKYNPLEDEE